MPPYTAQEAGDAASRAVGADDVAAVVGYSPSPPPSLPGTPSPPPEAAQQDQQHLDWRAAAVDYLARNYNLRNQLVQICGTDELASVEGIRMRVVSREMSLQRLHIYLPSITTLNLDGSILVSLRDLGCGLTNLRVLHVCRCDLESLDGLLGLTGLVELHADGNRVDDVDSCACLTRVRLLDLSRNEINVIGYVQFLSICTELEELSLAGCPVADAEDYRESVKKYLPQLRTLDGQQIREASPQGVVEARDESDHSDGGEGVSPPGSAGMSDASRPSSSAGSTSFLPSIWGDSSSGDTCSGQSRRSVAILEKRPSSAAAGVKLPKLKSSGAHLKKRPASSTTICKILEDTSLGDQRNVKPLKRGRKPERKVGTFFEQKDDKKIAESNKLPSPPTHVKLKEEENATAVDYSSAVELLSTDTEDILEASRRWRAMYHAYRASNRAKWEAEENAEEKTSKENNGVRARPSTQRREQANTSYDADVSSNLGTSPVA